MEFYYRGVDRDVLVLKADGGIASTNAEEVVADLVRVARSGIRKLVVDCTGLGYISSSGVGMLIHLHNTLWAAGGQVKVASARGPVFRILEITKLARLFEIYPTVEEALGAFRRSSLQLSARTTTPLPRDSSKDNRMKGPVPMPTLRHPGLLAILLESSTRQGPRIDADPAFRGYGMRAK